MIPKKLGQVFQVSLKVTPLQIIIAAVLALVAAFVIKPEYKEEFKFAATLFGGTAAIYSAYYVGVGLRLKIERDRQQASFVILDMLNKPEFVQVRNLLEKEVGDHASMSQVAMFEKISGTVELDRAVTTVLGILEDASIAIQSDFVDEDILFYSMSAILLKSHSGLRGYIAKLRETTATPEYFLEVEKLARSWQDKKRLTDGTVIAPLSC